MRRLESRNVELAKDFGRRLFEATFGDEVRSCLRQSLDMASQQDTGLRLRLHLTAAPELADLPWEFLYDPSLNRFFVLSGKTPLVRYPRSARAHPAPGRAAAHPGPGDDLDAQRLSAAGREPGVGQAGGGGG